MGLGDHTAEAWIHSKKLSERADPITKLEGECAAEYQCPADWQRLTDEDTNRHNIEVVGDVDQEEVSGAVGIEPAVHVEDEPKSESERRTGAIAALQQDPKPVSRRFNDRDLDISPLPAKALNDVMP